MAHQVNPATGNTILLDSSTAVRVDPTPPSAKRYKVTIVNTHATDRVFVSYYFATCAVGSGHVVEADYGVREFFIDSNVALWAVREGATVASPNITIVVDEYETV